MSGGRCVGNVEVSSRLLGVLGDSRNKNRGGSFTLPEPHGHEAEFTEGFGDVFVGHAHGLPILLGDQQAVAESKLAVKPSDAPQCSGGDGFFFDGEIRFRTHTLRVIVIVHCR